LRRLIMIGTALAVLGLAAAAYAATFNNYNGSSLKFGKGAGTKAKPVPLGMVETLRANAPAGDRAAPLIDIKLTIYGVKFVTSKLPACSDAKIEQDKTNPTGGCSPKSVIGGGPVHSELGPGTDPSAAKGSACDPFLHVFNGGAHKQVFFFYTKSATDCGGLTTGSTAPYDARISYAGKNAIVDVPLPADISTKVANQPNFYGSLITETLTFPKKASGKAYMVGVGCKNGKRPWSIQFTATKYNGGGNETQTVKGASKC
jgi:hypothetical protein